MSWGDVFASVYDPDDLTQPKSVSDNGRTVQSLRVLGASGTWEADGFGDGSITLHIKERDAYPLITKGDIIHVYQSAPISAGPLTIAEFIAQVIEPAADPEGGTITISGPGTAWELTDRLVLQPAIDDGAGGKSTTSMSQANAYSPYTWTITPGYAGDNGDYLAIAKHNVWEAIKTMANTAGYPIRYESARKIRIVKTPAATGLQVIENTGTNLALFNNTNYAPIRSISRPVDHSGYYTRCYIEGAKLGDAPLGIAGMTETITIPAGYTVYYSSNLIVNTAEETASGRRVERVVEFPDIKPADDSATAKQSAQEILLTAGLEHAAAAVGKTIVLNIETVMTRDITVGDTVYVNYSEDAAGEITFTVDGNYYVHKIKHTTGTNDVRITNLELSNVPLPVSGSDGVARLVETVKLLKTQVDNVTGSGQSSAPSGNHGLLTGLEDDDHPQYLLAAGGRTLTGNLPVAAGVLIDGYDISVLGAQVAASTHPPASVASSTPNNALYINPTTQAMTFIITAGSGLVYSGTTMNVNYGDGLTINNDVLKVLLQGNSGLVVSGGGLAMADPGTLTAATVNAKSGTTHTHDIWSYSDAYAATNNILQTDSDGYLRVKRFQSGLALKTELVEGEIGASVGYRMLTQNGHFTAEYSLDIVAGNYLYLKPATLRIDPSNDLVEVMPVTEMRSDQFNTGFLQPGWSIDYDGNIDALTLTVDELRAHKFIVEAAIAKRMAIWVTPGSSTLTADFTIPALGQPGYLWVEDMPGLPGFAVFDDGDTVEVDYWEYRTGGHLYIMRVYGTVSNFLNESNTSRQRYTFVTTRAGFDGSAAGKIVKEGSPAVSFGNPGSGGVEIRALDRDGSTGADNGGGYVKVFQWGLRDFPTPGNVWDDFYTRTQFGNLEGITGTRNEFGLFAGESTAAYEPHLLISNLQAGFYQIPVRLYDVNENLVIDINPNAGDPFISIGYPEQVRIDATGIDVMTQANLAYYEEKNAYTFKHPSTGEILGGVFSRRDSSTMVVALEVQSVSGIASSNLMVRANKGTLTLRATNSSGVYGDITIIDGRANIATSQLQAPSIFLGAWTSEAYTMPQGQIVQRAPSGSSGFFQRADILNLNTGMYGTDWSANTAYSVSRLGSNGGAYINGMSSGVQSLWIVGRSNAVSGTISESGQATITIDAKHGQAGDPVGNTSNAVVFRSGGLSRVFIRGNGDIYARGTYQEWDDYDDIEMLAALDLNFASSEEAAGRIRRDFDNFIRHNRDDLINAGVITESNFINIMSLFGLHTGAVRQLFNMINSVSARVGAVENLLSGTIPRQGDS